MFALVSEEKITLLPGALFRLPATWEDYQILSAQRDERSLPRLKYFHGELLIMSPLPKHVFCK
jgi:Uma2 family endonuclease